MRTVALYALLFLLIGLNPVSGQDESVIFHRIEILYHTKQQVMNRIWPGVADPAYSVPLIYFTDYDSYVVNPPQRFVEQYEPRVKYQTDQLIIFKMQSRLDSVPIHMEAKADTNPQVYNYALPFAQVSGPEQVKKVFKGLDMEIWSGMVLKELFHGYQMQHRGFYKNALDSKALQSSLNDTLQQYYKKYPWFKKSVDEENAIILQAIDEPDRKTRDGMIQKMLTMRDTRRNKLNQELKTSIDYYEKFFETTEGTAKYIEAQMCEHFYKINMSARMKIGDSVEVKSPALNDDPEKNYQTELSRQYTDATGYNLARLLDKLSITYKKRLFREPQLTLEDILRSQYVITD